ncbi:MAG: hypothetical protein MUF01_15705 [Bryobacterales bacterium]|nr:hypothetical protein [Bryobacterales bacterium]
MPAISAARRIAFDVLLQVERGGYASDLLHHRSPQISSADAGLARELVFGVLRRRPQLDCLLQPHLTKPIPRLDVEVTIALRMGALQAHFLHRIPAHALVSECVSLVKLARKSSAAGMVNAVLRKVLADTPPHPWPSREVALCQPEWLLARWQQNFGADGMQRIADAFLRKPDVFVRVPDGVAPPQHPGVSLEATELPGCYRLAQGNAAALLARHPQIRQMDIGSQWVASLVDAKPGQRVLDLCAAPGNKTAVVSERAPVAAACDLHLSRLRNMPPPPHPRVQLDGRTPLPFRTRFDWILLDAPCSGTGTLGRNPEIRWRLQPDKLTHFPPIQADLLRNALLLLAQNGTLVYSTCSLEPEENECILRDICHDEDVRVLRRVPGEASGDGFFAALIRP